MKTKQDILQADGEMENIDCPFVNIELQKSRGFAENRPREGRLLSQWGQLAPELLQYLC